MPAHPCPFRYAPGPFRRDRSLSSHSRSGKEKGIPDSRTPPLSLPRDNGIRRVSPAFLPHVPPLRVVRSRGEEGRREIDPLRGLLHRGPHRANPVLFRRVPAFLRGHRGAAPVPEAGDPVPFRFPAQADRISACRVCCGPAGHLSAHRGTVRRLASGWNHSFPDRHDPDHGVHHYGTLLGPARSSGPGSALAFRIEPAGSRLFVDHGRHAGSLPASFSQLRFLLGTCFRAPSFCTMDPDLALGAFPDTTGSAKDAAAEWNGILRKK